MHGIVLEMNGVAQENTVANAYVYILDKSLLLFLLLPYLGFDLI